MMTTVVASALIGLTAAVQGLVTRRLWRSPLFEHRQKVAQTLLVWCLPAVGAAVVHAALRHGEDVREMEPNRESGEFEALWDSGDDPDAGPPGGNG